MLETSFLVERGPGRRARRLVSLVRRQGYLIIWYLTIRSIVHICVWYGKYLSDTVAGYIDLFSWGC